MIKGQDHERRARPTLFTGGEVVHADGTDATSAAMVIQHGRVAALGSVEEMEAAAGADAVRIDLDGATVIPGLVDTHPHLMHWGGFSHAVVPLFDAKDYDDIVGRIRKAAETTPPGEWIQCSPIGEPHYFMRHSYRDLAEGELPTREILDQAAPDNPVWIQAWAPVNPNITVFNTRGLHRIQISHNSPDRIGRVDIEKDDNGEPTGRFLGPVNNYYNNEPWWDSILARIYTLTGEDFIEGAKQGMIEANRRGVTSIYEGHIMDWPLIDIYRMLRGTGELSLRVKCTPDGEPHGLPTSVTLTYPELHQRLEQAVAIQDLTDDLLRVEGFLCTRGGPIGPGMHVWHRRYRNAYGEWTNGLEFLPPEKGKYMVDFAAERGVRMSLISVADREHDIALEQIEAANKKWDITDKGWTLVHAYFMAPEYVKRYHELGFDVTTSMSFSHFKIHIFRERLGTDVLRDLIPLQRMVNAGMNVACGSDWGPTNIFEHMTFAQTHTGVFGENNNSPDHGVSRLEAFNQWTRNGAHALRWEGLGTLAPGGPADLAIADRSPLTCPLEDLTDTVVHSTFVDGTCVHDDGRFGV